MGREGFEPPKSYDTRFTVWRLYPLAYLPKNEGTPVFNELSATSLTMLDVFCDKEMNYYGLRLTTLWT